MESKKSEADIQQSAPGDYKFGGKADTFEYRGVNEQITMNRYHLTLVLERLKKGSKVPNYGDVWPWVGVFLALLLSLIPADFQDYWGLPAATWQAIALLLTGVSLVVIVCVLWRAYRHRDERAKTPEEEVQGIIGQMAADREKLDNPTG